MKLLSSLCGAMVVGAVMLLACLSGAAWADEASAVKAVQKHGGQVYCDDKLPGKPVTAVDFTRVQVTDAGLKELAHLKQLTSLDVWGTKVTDAGLKELAHLKQLTWLRLGEAYAVTDAGLKELADLKQLTSLSLSHTQVTDGGLK